MQKNGKECIRLNIHCPRSPLFQADNPCTDMRIILWQHEACGTADWIDGNGMVHCNCAQRNIFDLRFRCTTNVEAAGFANFLDLRNTLLSINMSNQQANPADYEQLSDWIQSLCN